jgi:hypothetical protein
MMSSRSSPCLGGVGHPTTLSLTNERHQDYKDFIRSLGWPLGDGSKWARDEAMKELQRVWPKYS